MNTQISWPTIITMLISSILAPWLASKGFTLTTPQESTIALWIISGFTLVVTLSAHLIHGKVKAIAAAKLMHPQGV